MSNDQQDETKTFDVTVDGETVGIPRKDVTPRDILEAAGLNPDSRYLVEIKGSNRVSYKGETDEEINVHENQKFVSNRLGNVPVS